jgi:hypothetical protein
MRFWWRELAGWAMVALGLVVFYVCIRFLLGPTHAVLEAPTLAFIGFILFRGGIQLLKVATAARICTPAPEPAPAARPGAGRPTSQRPAAVPRPTR